MTVEERPAPAGSLVNLVAAVVVVVIGAAGLVGSWSLGLGTPGAPQSGTWPFLVCIGIVVLGILLAVSGRGGSEAERFTPASWLVAAGLATMVGFVALIGVIGFEIPAALLAFVWMRFLGREGWLTSSLTSIGCVVAFYLVFVAALGVPIPHLF